MADAVGAGEIISNGLPAVTELAKATTDLLGQNESAPKFTPDTALGNAIDLLATNIDPNSDPQTDLTNVLSRFNEGNFSDSDLSTLAAAETTELVKTENGIAQLQATPLPTEQLQQFYDIIQDDPHVTLQNDPRYDSILNQKKQDWLSQNPGKTFTSESGQNVLNGRQDGKPIKTLGQSSEDEFNKLYPDSATIYKDKVYASADLDPTYQKMQQQIQTLAAGRSKNLSPDQLMGVQTTVAKEQADTFVQLYPDKAKTYAEQGNILLQEAIKPKPVTQEPVANNKPESDIIPPVDDASTDEVIPETEEVAESLDQTTTPENSDNENKDDVDKDNNGKDEEKNENKEDDKKDEAEAVEKAKKLIEKRKQKFDLEQGVKAIDKKNSEITNQDTIDKAKFQSQIIVLDQEIAVLEKELEATSEKSSILTKIAIAAIIAGAITAPMIQEATKEQKT